MPNNSNPNGGVPPPAPRISLLRCRACGHTLECQSADLLHYIKTDWPRCCGQVMPLFLPADPELQKPPDA